MQEWGSLLWLLWYNVVAVAVAFDDFAAMRYCLVSERRQRDRRQSRYWAMQPFGGKRSKDTNSPGAQDAASTGKTQDGKGMRGQLDREG